MSDSVQMIELPERLFQPGQEPHGVNKRINKHCDLKIVETLRKELGDDFQQLEETFFCSSHSAGQ